MKGRVMSLSMYQASAPVFVAMLTNLAAILEKAEAYAKERKIDKASCSIGALLQTCSP
jgi:hypothetical protein